MNSVIQDIIDKQWCRGSILKSNSIPELPDGIYVVVSHDCDIVHQKIQDEPRVELYLISPINEVDGNYTNLKNLRRLHITIRENEHYEIFSKDFRELSKDSLFGITPIAKFNEEVTDIIIRWRKGKIDRSALPDSFNNRLKNNNFREKLEKKLKKLNHLIIDVYIQLNTEESLSDDEDYRIRLLILVKEKNTQTKDFLEWFVSNAPKGIIIENDYRTSTKADVTLEEFEEMKKLWLDYLS